MSTLSFSTVELRTTPPQPGSPNASATKCLAHTKPTTFPITNDPNNQTHQQQAWSWTFQLILIIAPHKIRAITALVRAVTVITPHYL